MIAPLRAGLVVATLTVAAPSLAMPCALELILAIDVSGSVDIDEHALQQNGTATAFEDPSVIDAISRLPGGMLVTMTQWSGISRQRQVTGWAHLTDETTTRAFAAEVRQTPRLWHNFSTAIGEALDHARALSADAPIACTRKVIDISGDGVSNEGVSPLEASRRLTALGYTINGLVIRGAEPDPLVHYQELVIGGPGAFIEIARDFSDYPRAIKTKLLREIDQPMIVSEARPAR